MRKNVAFRFPEQLRLAVQEVVADDTEQNQSTYLMTSAKHVLEEITRGAPVSSLLLPQQIDPLAWETTMASVRATDAEMLPYRELAQRCYQHFTRFLLWSATLQLPTDRQATLHVDAVPNIFQKHAGLIQIPKAVARQVCTKAVEHNEEPDVTVERACRQFLRAVDRDVAFKKLLLQPHQFKTTTRGVPTIGVRAWKVHFTDMDILQRMMMLAQRLAHTPTTLILWASVWATT